MKVIAFLVACGAAHGATLRYWVEPCSKAGAGLPPGCQTGDPELAQWAMEAWQAASAGKLVLEKTADREKAHIRLNWTNGKDGLYGEARPIVVEGVRGAEVYVLPPGGDDDALMRETVVYLTCLHE